MTLVKFALLEGMVWSILWIAMLMPMFFHFPWLLVHDYPEDARKAARLSEPTHRQRCNGIIFTVLCYVVLIGTLMATGLVHYNTGTVSLGVVFLHLWIICLTWNVVDLVVLDWLVFCTITPKFFVLPGTQGCKGYKDYNFHFRGFLKGCVYMTLFAFVFSAIDFIILKFLIW